MRFYAAIIVLLVIGAATLVMKFGADARTFMEIGLLAALAAPLAVRHTPRLYVMLQKLKSLVLNTSATWELSVRLSPYHGEPSLEEIAQDVMRVQRRGRARLVSTSHTRLIMQTNRRFVVELHSNPIPLELPGEGAPVLNIDLSPVTVGYRSSRAFLEDELLPLLERIAGLVKSADEAVYSLRVDLPEANPFFGLYLQQMKLPSVSEFRIEVELPAAGDRRHLVIERERMTVVSTTPSGFRKAAFAALAFSVPRD